eukprot:6180354-Amphidinium_carterae.1
MPLPARHCNHSGHASPVAAMPATPAYAMPAAAMPAIAGHASHCHTSNAYPCRASHSSLCRGWQCHSVPLQATKCRQHASHSSLCHIWPMPLSATQRYSMPSTSSRTDGIVAGQLASTCMPSISDC